MMTDLTLSGFCSVDDFGLTMLSHMYFLLSISFIFVFC